MKREKEKKVDTHIFSGYRKVILSHKNDIDFFSLLRRIFLSFLFLFFFSSFFFLRLPKRRESIPPKQMAEKISKHLELHSGGNIPRIGLGTWKSSPGEVGQAVKHAILEAGYRHLDCASIYGNEAEIGEALKEVFATSSITRSDLFLTSKVFNHFHGDLEKVSVSVDRTIRDLGVDYLDLVLIHWPIEFVDAKEPLPTPMRLETGFPHPSLTPREEYLATWTSFEGLFKLGKVKSIGVSNFNIRQLEAVLKDCTIKPSVNQVEFHPLLVQSELHEFCKKNGIVLEAYSPLGSGDSYTGKMANAPSLLKNDLVNSLAQKHGKSPAQILIRWSLEHGAVCLPKSTNPDRIAQNIDVFSFELSQEDISSLDGLNLSHRFGWGWLPNHFLPTQ